MKANDPTLKNKWTAVGVKELNIADYGLDTNLDAAHPFKHELAVVNKKFGYTQMSVQGSI